MHHIEQIEKLLKDELSATETYLQALDKFKEDVGLGEAEHLIPIYEDHKDAVSSLQALTLRLGGTPAEDSGAWGTWAKIILGGANMLGKESVLRTLQEGEKNGAEDYRRALEDTELLADIRALIETQLLPAQQGHINALERLLAVEA
ncbi:MAG: hypothetical protein CTY16_08440 [Methylobacter sp.]|nr:MAG: hypothetical protein CTY16_08440 [Methylobacter sp.]